MSTINFLFIIGISVNYSVILFWPTVLTVALLLQWCVCRLWRYVLWLNGAS